MEHVVVQAARLLDGGLRRGSDYGMHLLLECLQRGLVAQVVAADRVDRLVDLACEAEQALAGIDAPLTAAVSAATAVTT